MNKDYYWFSYDEPIDIDVYVIEFESCMVSSFVDLLDNHAIEEFMHHMTVVNVGGRYFEVLFSYMISVYVKRLFYFFKGKDTKTYYDLFVHDFKEVGVDEYLDYINDRKKEFINM